MIIYTPPQAAKTIPVIDLAEQDPSKTARAIHIACRETGFFYVSHHGIAPSLIAAQFDWAKRFFDLPLGEKMELDMRHSATRAGYEPIGGQILDSQDANAPAAPPDLKESFYCGREPEAELCATAPSQNPWPTTLPGFREQMLAYRKAVAQLGDRLLGLLALSLDLPPDWFEDAYRGALGTVRLIKYPPQPATASYNQIGAGAHTDWGGITLLAQDAACGLEVRNADGEWIEARPIVDTFIINLGDLTARWTNGLYNSTMHRVKNNRNPRDRYSVPFFYSPRADAVIEPISTCVGADHPRRFETCTASDHMAEMFRRSYGYMPKEMTA
jgi:isopenicillin N synthase-like dioxygenase